MVGQWWIVLSMIVAVCNAYEIQCPERTCSCHLTHNRDIEIHCPTERNSAFIVNVQPYKYIQVSTHRESLMLFQRESVNARGIEITITVCGDFEHDTVASGRNAWNVCSSRCRFLSIVLILLWHLVLSEGLTTREIEISKK